MSGASVHRSDVLSFKSEGVVSSRSDVEVLPAGELHFLDFLRSISADSDVKREKELCFVRLLGPSESRREVVFSFCIVFETMHFFFTFSN